MFMARAAAIAGNHDLESKCNKESYDLACSVKDLPREGLWLERIANIYTREQQLESLGRNHVPSHQVRA